MDVKIFTDNIEGTAINQVYNAAESPAFKDLPIRIMPDVHAGAGSVIGFTAPVKDKVIPNIVGVDIGCGMLTVHLGNEMPDLEAIDNFIRENIPYGFSRRETAYNHINLTESIENLISYKKLPHNASDYNLALGSLGGGNHFIEIAKDSGQDYKLIIHSGSRKLGMDIAIHYQKEAVKYHKENSNPIQKDLAYLEGEGMDNYIKDMTFAQEFASLSRRIMANEIIRFINGGQHKNYTLTEKGRYGNFETIHNYINPKDMILRKGAISAYENELVLIPINMRDGSILAIGKGNPDWNYSGPHGAGRILSRGAAKRTLSLEDYEKSMEGIYTTSVTKKTLDEAPMAYKGMDEILENIGDSVIVVDILKPVYNFKA